MADGDDQDRSGPPDDEGALGSWGGLDDAGPARVSRSWSQIAALDEQGRPPSPGHDPRPVEGLLTVDSGLLDIMAREQAADSGSTDDVAETPSELPLDDILRENAALDDDPFGVGDADFDDPAGGALPDAFGFDDAPDTSVGEFRVADEGAAVDPGEDVDGPFGADGSVLPGGQEPDDEPDPGASSIETVPGAAAPVDLDDPDPDSAPLTGDVSPLDARAQALGAEVDDWLDAALDPVGGAVDDVWGEPLDDGAYGAPATDAPASRAALSDAPGPVPGDADLWAVAAAQWDDEPEPAAGPGSMPFDDPFAAPAPGGVEDDAAALSDPFTPLAGDPARRAAEAPDAGPLDSETPRDGLPDPDEQPTSPPATSTTERIEAALALLVRRSQARRSERLADANDPEVMMVEAVLEDGPERRVVQVEYPRLGELEILELPEGGGELPGLDDDFDPFADGYVFFEDDALDASPPDRRSALATLSREPVELARLLEPATAGEAAPAGVDDPTDTAQDEPVDDADDPIDQAPLPSPFSPTTIAGHTGRGPDVHPTAAPLPFADLDDGALTDIEPGWSGVELAGVFDPELIERIGAPFIGIIPPFGGRTPVGPFPPGSLAARRSAADDGPAVVPRLTIQLPAERTWAHRLACFLIDEASTEPERGRLAALLHSLGTVAHRPLGDERVALDALRAAVENNPDLALSRWSLQALLDEAGLHDELLDLLLHPPGLVAGTPRQADGDARHRAGHLARTALGDDAQALWQWARGSTDRPHAASRLARYLMLAGQADHGAALDAVDALLEAVEGPTWWSALALDRVRRDARAAADGAPLDLQRTEVLLEEAIRRRGAVPAVFAAVERHALAQGRMSLWLSALRARFDRIMGDFERGDLPEDQAQLELAEIFVKAGLALETLGRRTEALTEYHNALRSLPDDPYALHRAAELARRLGDHEALRRHLDRLAQLAHTPGERADAAYQMGLLAQQIMGDDNAAERDFTRALAALPTMTAALAALGRLDLRRGRTDAIQDRYADEIRALEAALRLPQAAAERRRTITTLVDRYYRLARLLEETGDASVALDVYKRALAVDPRFMPAFEAMDRLYVRHGRWRERTALILGWVQRQEGAPLDAVGPLLTAADALRVHLDDPENAARVAARTLALAPDHPYAVRRASESFARLGNTAARIEVDLRWGRLDGDVRGPQRLLRAAQLQELDGDPLAAAAEALPLYREALARDPESVGAIDGLMRTALRLGRTGELVQQVEAHDLAAHPSPVLALPIAEALLAAGRPDEAAGFLVRWRARARVARTLDRAADAGSLALLALACERTDHWRMLADTLEEQAALGNGRSRAVLLARAGALWELRLEEPALAADAYRRALQADAECAAARAGATRLEALDRGDWRPSGVAARALAEARTADAAGDAARRTAALDAVGATADDPRTAIAWRALARGEETRLEAAAALYAAHPERGDLFAAYRRRLRAAGDVPALIEALWLRTDYEDAPGRVALLTAIIGHGLRIDDRVSVTEAAENLLEQDPRCLPALFALRRLARTADDPAGGAEVARTLTGVLRAPGPAAAAHHAVAIDAEARGEPPAQVRRLLTRAVELNPTDDEAASALGERLRAAGEWDPLVDLHRRRLAAIAEPERRRPVARTLARLLVDRFEDAAGAWRVLRRELAAEAADPETALLAADIASRAGRHADADACFALAAKAEGGRMRLQAMRGQAHAWQARGETRKARALVDGILRLTPDDTDALSLLAELLASEQQWKGVVTVFRRLMSLEPDPAAQADRALAIGEIFARVQGDAGRAAGWFKRAIELDPDRLRAVWRLIEEAEKAPDGAVPIEHIEDAIDRAITGRRIAIAERPDPEALDDLARLHARRGDRDGQLLVGEALCWLGLADQRTRRWVQAAHKRVSVDFARPLSDALRRELLEDPAERGRDRLVFDAFALVLTEVLAGAMPAGVARLSRRSFPEWQAEFRRLAVGLGVDDVELHNGGRAVVRFHGLYLPRAALAVPQSALSGPLDARQAFSVGQLIDGLREGRLLLDAPGVERVQRCAAVMAAALCPGLLPDTEPGAIPTGLRDRLTERARRLPRRIKLQLDGLAARAEGPVDLHRLAQAVAATGDRAGLICCANLHVALDQRVFPDAATADAARRSGGVPAALDASPAGRALLTYALGADHARLRRVLGLGLSGRVG